MKYIIKITEYKNIVMLHKTDKRRSFMKKELLKIDFDDSSSLLLVMKPKKYQNCFNAETFELKKSFTTREKILYEVEES